MHTILRNYSMMAWQQIAAGGTNPLPDMLSADEEITRYMPSQSVRDILDASEYMGAAATMARRMAAEIRTTVVSPSV